MSAQTSLALEQTPVIVKSGGGGDGDALSNHVMIDSPIMPFAESVPGRTWKSSQSTQTGRIHELNIEVANEPAQDYPIKPSDELASITIEYGLAQLQFMESGVGNDIVLVIKSDGVPFNVAKEGDWKKATATFPAPITRVTFMVGNNVVVSREFTKHDITLNIDFYRSLGQ